MIDPEDNQHDHSVKATQIEGPRYGKRKSSVYTNELKKKKKRTERRRAKRNPECVPMYGRYKGWEW